MLQAQYSHNRLPDVREPIFYGLPRMAFIRILQHFYKNVRGEGGGVSHTLSSCISKWNFLGRIKNAMHVLWNFKNNNRKLHLLFLQTFSVPNAPTCSRLLKVETLDTQYLLLNPFRWPSRHVRNYWPLDSERKEWWLLLDKWPSRKILSFMYSKIKWLWCRFVTALLKAA